MPVLQAVNISHQFDNGETLFESLSCTFNRSRVGLVGKNGVGKSVLASIFSGAQRASSGAVTVTQSLAVYHQQSLHALSGDLSIAQLLGKENVLTALKQIEAGNTSAHLFELVGEQWCLPLQLMEMLDEMGLPPDFNFPCAQLSGGQLARLQLQQVFDRDVELLILDEPSNHLDSQAKRWLIESMSQFSGAILLISHDRELLREMEEIWELSTLGLQVFGGNYDAYAKQKRMQLQAAERQLVNVDRQRQHLQEQAQLSREKAQQRAAKGNQLRKEGSQPKVLLDSKKDKATARASNRNKNEQLRHRHLQEKEQNLKAKIEQMKVQKLYLAQMQRSSRKVISMLDVTPLFGSAEPISLQVFAGDKIHLVGKNGSGKSTLLKTLQGQLSPKSGELQVNTRLYYLDQHFSVVSARLSMLDNLMRHCDKMLESEARTLLAGVGFRRNSVFRYGNMLSGGEKMKLAMLIASHQPSQPFLLLDEPDNHLDLDSKIMLAQALNAYQGGFILISHDRDFAVESGVNRDVEIG